MQLDQREVLLEWLQWMIKAGNWLRTLGVSVAFA
jgi:hypothetical protein